VGWGVGVVGGLAGLVAEEEEAGVGEETDDE
jgi:hypothetical protein